jgi:hypothetical protein
MAGRGRGWLLASLLLAACAQAPQPVQPAEAKPEAVRPPETAAEPAAQPAPPSLETEPAAPAPPPDPTVIVIEPGGVDSGDVDLVAASAAERERRAAAPPASRSITNQNLVKAKPGEKLPGKPVKPAEPAGVAPAAPAPGGTGEAFWRSRSRELRQRWKDVVDEVADLESDADLLRRRFYAEADPYVRDGRIKPDWDRVLDRIRTLREEAERRREAVTAHLEEGRRAGALPGWLREGIDLEPAAEGARPEDGPHEAVEPPIYPEPREPIAGDDGDEDGDG